MPIVVTLNRIPEITLALPVQLQAALNEVAEVMAQTAQQLVSINFPPSSSPGGPPARRTGDLQASIQAIHDAGPLEADVVAGGGTVNYAVGLEYGQTFVAARPFLTPAVEQTKPLIEGIVVAAVTL